MSPASPADPAEPGADANGDGQRRWSRRWFLAGGAAAVVGGGAGVGAGFLHHRSTPAPRKPPAALLTAIAAERGLLALAAAAVRSDPTLRTTAALLTGDHAAHLHALQAALSGYDPQPAGPTPTAGLATTSSARVQLRAAESAAAAAAGRRALQLAGAPATLLASIAACESTHVELLA